MQLFIYLFTLDTNSRDPLQSPRSWRACFALKSQTSTSTLLHLAAASWSEWSWTHLLPRSSVLTRQARQTGHSRCSRIALRTDPWLCDICKIWTLLLLLWAMTYFRSGISGPPLSCGSSLSWQPLVSLKNIAWIHQDVHVDCCHLSALEWMQKPWVQAAPLLVGPCSPVAPWVLPCPAKTSSFTIK